MDLKRNKTIQGKCESFSSSVVEENKITVKLMGLRSKVSIAFQGADLIMD